MCIFVGEGSISEWEPSSGRPGGCQLELPKVGIIHLENTTSLVYLKMLTFESIFKLVKAFNLGVVVHFCNSSTWETDAGESLMSLRPAWAT